MMTDRRTSELIDDVAREMTAIHTMPPVRARVLARLDTVRRTPVPYFTWATAGAALLIVCVMVIPMRPPSATRVSMGPAAPTARAADTTTGAASGAPATTLAAANQVSVLKSAPSGANEETPAEAEWRARRIASLPAIDAGAIQPGTLDLPLLSMAPVTTAPIVMTPLSSDDDDLE